MTARKPRIPKPCKEVNWKTEACENGHIHVTLMQPGLLPYEFIVESEDAYAFASDVLKTYDQINGI